MEKATQAGSKEMIAAWEPALQAAKPYMFALADELLENYPERRWNMLICDDTSARLPSAFVQEVLRLQGINLPMNYIAAGNKARQQTPIEAYRRHVQQLLAVQAEPRVLIVSEAAGTYKSAAFLKELFMLPGAAVDFGIVAAHREPPPSMGNVYVGGFGVTTAAKAVFEAFEQPKLTPRQMASDKWWVTSRGTVLTGLKGTPKAGQATVENYKNSRYAPLVAYCARRMLELAAEYNDCRAQPAGAKT